MTYLNDKGRPISLSYSAYSTFVDCRRKWYYAYKMRLPQPYKRATWLGGQVHNELEHFGKTGEWKVNDIAGQVDLPQAIARSAEPYLPAGLGDPDGPWDIERELKAPDLLCGPLPFKGFVDYGRVDDGFFIGDYKTRGDLRYAVSPGELAKHKQPCSYAYAYAHILGIAVPDTVRFQHINIHTAPAGVNEALGIPTFKVEVVDAVATKEQVLTAWADMTQAAHEMAAILETTKEAEDVPGNTLSCAKYGGCDYADRCPLSPRNRATPEMYHSTTPADLPKGDPAMSKKQMALRQRLGLGAPTSPLPESPRITNPKSPAPDADRFVQSIASSLRNGTPLSVSALTAMARGRNMSFDALQEAIGFEVKDGLCYIEGGEEAKADPPAKTATEAPPAEAPVTATAPAPPLTDMQVQDMDDNLQDKHRQHLAGNKALRFLIALDLQNADGSRTAKGEYLVQRLNLEDKYSDVAAPPAKVPEKAEEKAKYSDVAAEAVLAIMADNPGPVDRGTLSDAVLAADSSAQRVRYTRVLAILEEGGIASEWTYSKVSGEFRRVAGESPEEDTTESDTGDVGTDEPEADDTGDNTMFISAGVAKDFLEQEGWGTPVNSAKMWLQANGYEGQMDAFLRTIGGQVMHDMVLPGDFTGSRRDALQAYRKDAMRELDMLARLEAEHLGVKDNAPQETKPVEAAPVEELEEEDPDVSYLTVLYLNCMPDDRRGVMELSDFLAPAIARVEEAGGEVDREFIKPLPYWNLLDFAKGPKVVAGVLALMLRSGDLTPPSGLVVDMRHAAAVEVVEVLRQQVNCVIVRGM